MVRLQRVTFTALHQYLGLSAELVNPVSIFMYIMFVCQVSSDTVCIRYSWFVF